MIIGILMLIVGLIFLKITGLLFRVVMFVVQLVVMTLVVIFAIVLLKYIGPPLLQLVFLSLGTIAEVLDWAVTS